jgi:hypothetical protein
VLNKIENFEKKPAVGGIPAIEKKEIVQIKFIFEL